MIKIDDGVYYCKTLSVNVIELYVCCISIAKTSLSITKFNVHQRYFIELVKHAYTLCHSFFRVAAIDFSVCYMIDMRRGAE